MESIERAGSAENSRSLCAIVDWASRKVLSHRVSISMGTSLCLEALEEAFAKLICRHPLTPEAIDLSQAAQGHLLLRSGRNTDLFHHRVLDHHRVDQPRVGDRLSGFVALTKIRIVPVGCATDW